MATSSKSMGRQTCLLSMFFLVGASTWATPINNTANLSVAAEGTDFLEFFGSGNVTFTVTNNTGVPLILDYALAIIVQTGGDDDDLVNFGGVTADTQIAAPRGSTGQFKYNIINPQGDPFEPEDNGKDNVYFWVEYSDSTGCTANPTPVINVRGRGVFDFPGPICPNATVDANVLAGLTACLNNPNPTAAACAPNMALYSNSFSPPLNQFPSVAPVTVTDVPEPATFFCGLCAFGLIGALFWSRYQRLQ